MSNKEELLNNDSTALKIAIAGFLHDIGKLVEIDAKRANEIRQKYDDNAGKEFYCPKNEFDIYTHRHAYYTACALDDEGLGFPDILRDRHYGFNIKNNNGNEEVVRIIEVSARHHLKFDTNDSFFNEYVNIIKEADRLASSSERELDENEGNVYPKDYLKTRLTSILANISINKDEVKEVLYKLPLKKLSPTSIFPKYTSNEENNEVALSDYKDLLDGFYEDVKGLPFKERNKENLRLWFEAFDSLWLKYAANIPEARAGKNAKDTSLYDHSRLTSAFASALYLYHKENEDNISELSNIDLSLSERNKEKFMLIAGDFCGIQKFIFGDFSGDSHKYASKILRARSIMVSLYTELAASMICEKVGLPHTSVIFNAGGKFTILAPNIDRVKNAVSEARKEINDWLVENFYGECSFVFAYVPASSDEFLGGKYRNLQMKLHDELEKEKYNKFSKNNFGVFEKYLDSVHSSQDVCKICGKRCKIENEDYCDICNDFIRFGENFVKEKYLVVINENYWSDSLREFRNEYKHLVEIFGGKYKVVVINEKALVENLDNAKLLSKVWYYGIDEKTNVKLFARKFINGYVASYYNGDEDIKEEYRDYSVKSFEVISSDANKYKGLGIIQRDDKKKEDPINALGVLKADVDNLGAIMACCLQDKMYTISRLSTFSRQLDFFFSYYLPYYLNYNDNENFKNVYTVFGGGDDLFLIGPWNVMQDLVIKLDEKFKEYVGNNQLLHFSAGLFICKDNIPVRIMGDNAEELLSDAKSSNEDGKKHKLNIFGEIVSFDEVSKLIEFRDYILGLFNNGNITNTFLYSLNRYIKMSEDERKILKNNKYNIKSLECMKWKSHLAYNLSRNLKIEKDDDINVNEVYKILRSYIEEYNSKLRIPLWTILYSIRGNR